MTMTATLTADQEADERRRIQQELSRRWEIDPADRCEDLLAQLAPLNEAVRERGDQDARAAINEVADAAAALHHPIRRRILTALADGRERTPKVLAAGFGLRLENVSYHVRVLRDMRLIKLQRRKQVRGAVEHHYVLTDAGRGLLGLDPHALAPPAKTLAQRIADRADELERDAAEIVSGERARSYAAPPDEEGLAALDAEAESYDFAAQELRALLTVQPTTEEVPA